MEKGRRHVKDKDRRWENMPSEAKNPTTEMLWEERAATAYATSEANSDVLMGRCNHD